MTLLEIKKRLTRDTWLLLTHRGQIITWGSGGPHYANHYTAYWPEPDLSYTEMLRVSDYLPNTTEE